MKQKVGVAGASPSEDRFPFSFIEKKVWVVLTWDLHAKDWKVVFFNSEPTSDEGEIDLSLAIGDVLVSEIESIELDNKPSLSFRTYRNVTDSKGAVMQEVRWLSPVTCCP